MFIFCIKFHHEHPCIHFGQTNCKHFIFHACWNLSPQNLLKTPYCQCWWKCCAYFSIFYAASEQKCSWILNRLQLLIKNVLMKLWTFHKVWIHELQWFLCKNYTHKRERAKRVRAWALANSMCILFSLVCANFSNFSKFEIKCWMYKNHLHAIIRINQHQK